jgi:zinc D-Ala-D-Ala carboxypeptidase
MSKISKYLTYKEVTKSNTALRRGIDNTPNKMQLEELKNIGEKIFDPVREFIGKALGVTSGFRSYKLNKAINRGRVVASQHTEGQALDIDADVYGNGTNGEIFHFIKDSLEFDQLIAEFKQGDQPAWIHVSLKKSGNNRGEVLIAKKSGRRTVYMKYTEDLYNKTYKN